MAKISRNSVDKIVEIRIEWQRLDESLSRLAARRFESLFVIREGQVSKIDLCDIHNNIA